MSGLPHSPVLQIVFFEMNYFFKTDSERNKVIPELRLPSIVFPSDWDPKRSKQRQSKLHPTHCNDHMLMVHFSHHDASSARPGQEADSSTAIAEHAAPSQG